MTFVPDPSKFTPKANPSLPHEPLFQNVIDEQTISSLQHLDREALISLIQRVSGAMWGVGLKTKEDIAEAFKLKLAISGMAEKDMFKALPIMREWFDRELGKASQSIAMTVEDKGLGKLSDEKLLRLERELARITGQDAIVISPQPQKLENTTFSSD